LRSEERNYEIGLLTRVLANISRKNRVLLVVIALCLSIAIMILIQAGLMANEVAAKQLAENHNLSCYQ